MCKGCVTRVSNSFKDYIDKETVLDRVKLNEMLNYLDKCLITLDMVQDEFELPFEEDSALLAEIETTATYRDSICDILVKALQYLEQLTLDKLNSPLSDIASNSSVEIKLPKLSLSWFYRDVLHWQSFGINLRPRIFEVIIRRWDQASHTGSVSYFWTL